VGDVCYCLIASMAAPCAGAVYNVVDDEPAPRAAVTTFTRRLLGVQPPVETAPLCSSTGEQAEQGESRCVCLLCSVSAQRGLLRIHGVG